MKMYAGEAFECRRSQTFTTREQRTNETSPETDAYYAVVAVKMSFDDLDNNGVSEPVNDLNQQSAGGDLEQPQQQAPQEIVDQVGGSAAGKKPKKFWKWLLVGLALIALILLLTFVVAPAMGKSSGNGASSTGTGTNTSATGTSALVTTATNATMTPTMAAASLKASFKGPNHYDGAEYQQKWQRIDGARRLTSTTQGKPYVVELNSLLKLTECQEIIDMCEKHSLFIRSRVLESNTPVSQVTSFRTSESAHLARGQTPLVAEIEKRVAAIIGCPVSHLEPLQVVRYTPGQQFRPHHDYFAPGTPGHARAMATSGQRQSTIFIYLNDMETGETGGRTIFPKLELAIRPRAGKAVWWCNCKPNGQEEPLTLHAGEPPIKSTKYAINVWSRPLPYLPM
jgi:hypothetical protein